MWRLDRCSEDFDVVSMSWLCLASFGTRLQDFRVHHQFINPQFSALSVVVRRRLDNFSNKRIRATVVELDSGDREKIPVFVRGVLTIV